LCKYYLDYLWYLIHYFVQQPLYLLHLHTSFLHLHRLPLFQMFRRLSSPRSFDGPKWPLVHKHAFLPIPFSGIELIPTTTITSIAYLVNWALVDSIIIVRFMVNQHLFLLEALAQINNAFLF
jgi:hypothetical protein